MFVCTSAGSLEGPGDVVRARRQVRPAGLGWAENKKVSRLLSSIDHRLSAHIALLSHVQPRFSSLHRYHLQFCTFTIGAWCSPELLEKAAGFGSEGRKL
jgi:hypothetical protein